MVGLGSRSREEEEKRQGGPPWVFGSPDASSLLPEIDLHPLPEVDASCPSSAYFGTSTLQRPCTGRRCCYRATDREPQYSIDFNVDIPPPNLFEQEKEVLEIPKNETDLGVVEEPPLVPSEIEASKDEKPVVKEADVWTLNAKIKEEKDPTFSATAGLQTIVSSDQINENGHAVNSDEKPPFVVDSDGSIPFYTLAAYEEFSDSNAGNIYLLWKVKAGNSYYRYCVVVKNMQRCMYAIPNCPVFEDSCHFEP
ncbi:hypothetical protein LXL04_014578 [Taraxacum kok-saghyz]